MKHYKHIKPEDFKQLKALLDAGVKRSKLSKVIGKSSATLGRIDASKDFQAYRDLLRSLNDKYRKTVTNGISKKEDTVQTTVLKELVRIGDLLESLSKRRGIML